MEQHDRRLPFPPIPDAITARYEASDLALRRFGLHERDLNVDFDRTPRPILVTRLLECCTSDARHRDVDEGLLWNLPIGKRLECLVILLCAGAGPEIDVACRCPDPACGEPSEIQISFEEISTLQAQAYASEHVVVPLGRDAVTLRRPTGSDQLAWLKSQYADKASAVHAMLDALVVDAAERSVHAEALSDEQIRRIEAAMDEHDPLINFSVRVTCPYCEAEHAVAIDWQEIALRALKQAQARLFASVHRLAAHYHWSEQQIFTVPPWRRAQYLGLIAKERSQ